MWIRRRALAGCLRETRQSPWECGARRDCRDGLGWAVWSWSGPYPLETRGNARKILNAATAAVMLHAVKSTIGGGEQFFRSVAIRGVRSGSGTGGKSGRLGFRRHFFVNAIYDTRGDVGIGLWKNDGKFVAAVARSSINRSAMIAENFAQPNQCAAAGEMAILIVDAFQAVHIEKHDAERALRAARTIQFRFHHAQQAAVICQTGQGIADGECANLVEESCLIQHGSK